MEGEVSDVTDLHRCIDCCLISQLNCPPAESDIFAKLSSALVIVQIEYDWNRLGIRRYPFEARSGYFPPLSLSQFGPDVESIKGQTVICQPISRLHPLPPDGLDDFDLDEQKRRAGPELANHQRPFVNILDLMEEVFLFVIGRDAELDGEAPTRTECRDNRLIVPDKSK